MDVNGTRFHLFKGEADWRRCFDGEGGQVWEDLFWDKQDEAVTLAPALSLFRHRLAETPLSLAARRGAASDSFGHWYWISNDRRRVYRLPDRTSRPLVFWTQTSAPCPTPPGAFGPQAAEPSPVELAGLAVTEHHYLVVGNVTQSGVFIFDLDAGGEPILLRFPANVAFEPFDIAPAPGGGVWILDRAHRSYWGLDRQFRVVAEPPPIPSPEPPEPDDKSVFRSVDGVAAIRPNKQFPVGFQLAAQHPVSIEALPDGSVIILDSPALADEPPPTPEPSSLYHYRLGTLEEAPLPLEADLEVVIEGREEREEHLSVAGYDLTAIADSDNLTVYVVERDGNQAIAFDLKLEATPPQLEVSRDYLPMHFFGGRALAARGREVFYDVVGGEAANDEVVNWVALHDIAQPHYGREAALLTTPLDGKERDCVWHRLFIDACIPREAGVVVWTRAHNDRDLLESVPFAPEPQLYLRGAGAELPFYDPFPGRKPLPEGVGTWETLFQQARGRFLQIKLELRGNGRVTPQLHSLRAYYPRFSYARRYLPAIYLEDAESASFLERFLANTEGFYSEIEGKLSDVSALFDARSAPPETLDWLARWVGLIVDPLWARLQERRGEGNGSNRPASDRRRLLIRFARKLYDRRGTLDGVRFALHLLLDSRLETLLWRLKMAAVAAATVRAETALLKEIARLNLPRPAPAMSDEQLEDLLYEFILSPNRPSQARIVERFLTRGGRSLVAGDPTQADSNAAGGETVIAASAHRFSALIPEGISADEEAMVRRIIELEKPAHTQFDVRRYWAYFRAGEARLGLDTVLGEDSRFRFAPMVIGRNYIAEGYLPASHPMNSEDRTILDRDRVGEMEL